MASFAYTPAKTKLLKALLDFQEAGSDIRAALVMTNTTADTEKDTGLMNAFSVLDEYDGSGYVRKALASQTVTEDDPNDRGVFDAADFTWTALGAGTRSAQGMLLFKFVTNDTDSIPLCYIDTGGFPFAGNGGDIVVQWNANGIIQTP